MSAAAAQPENLLFDPGAHDGLGPCWNRIGVTGDHSCPRLAEHVHCRNCQVLLDWVQALSEQPAPPFYVHEFPQQQADWAAYYALNSVRRTADDTSLGMAMLFRLADEWLALPVEVTQEIVEPQPPRSLPHRRGELVLGVINLRGELVICFSLARLLGIAAASAAAPGKPAPGRMIFPRMIVIGSPGRRVAFPADEVHGIHRFYRSDQTAPPATLTRAARSFCRATLAWNGLLVGALDAPVLLRAIDASIG